MNNRITTLKCNSRVVEIQLKHKELIKKHYKKNYKLSDSDDGLEWIDLDTDEELITLYKKSESLRKITEDEQRRLRNIRKEVYKQAKGTIRFFRNKKEQSVVPNNYIRFIYAITAATILLLLVINESDIKNKSNIDLRVKDSVKTSLDVSMDKETNELDYNINSISINTLNNNYVELQNITWLKNNLNTKSDYYMVENEEFLIDKNTQYGSFSITDTTVFIERINKQRTGNKELLLCNRLPYGINTNLMQRNGLRFKESSNPTQVKTLANSYDNSILMLSETLGGGKLSIESLQTPLLNMEYSMHKSDKLEGMYINFDEVGQLNIMEIPEVNTAPGIVYSKDDKILRVKNMSEDIEYIYISHINNEKFGCFAEDLIETTDEKLFVHMDYDNPNSIGYKTFAILSENNLYCFRINGLYHESLRLNIFEQLGIDMSEIEIKKIQRVIDNNEEH